MSLSATPLEATRRRATPPDLPPLLEQIRVQAETFAEHASERAETSSQWRGHIERLQRSVPSVSVEDDGATVYLGELSPGCIACKAGRWDCVFVTMRCNLNCSFCLKPHGASLPSMYSALGTEASALCSRYKLASVSGLSFSGGEPFLYPRQVLEWLSVFRREFPDLYIWAYTNGMTLSKELLEQLADEGLNEIRFNMAAVGYRDPRVIDMLREAVLHIPAVAVEVPAIPADADSLLSSLDEWAQAGVKYLNLHELIYEVGTNSERMPGPRVARTMPDGHRCATDRKSPDLIREVFERVAAGHIPLSVNDCSLRNKALQMRGRRRLLSHFALQPYEFLREDGLAECACVFRGDDFRFIHPDSLTQERRQYIGWHTVVLRRQLPLDLQNPGQWVHFGGIDEGCGA